MEVTDQIKERLNVAELVGEYLKLEKAGTNYKALCPFHNEKTPSFMVNPERNFWYCFGCQKGGDVFTFVMEMEGLEFREALERLADRSGVEIPRFKKKDPREKQQKEKLYEIVESANQFFQNQLSSSPLGSQAKKYLQERSIPEDQISQFQIGLAPDSWSSLLEYLLESGYSLSDIAKTGLLVQKANTSGGGKSDYYDRFRGRIMFPISDQVGKIVGHSARVMPGGDESSAKYINTPQTEIYDKSRILYGLNLAKTAIKREGFAVVVEGNMDVMASFGAGVENIVAVSGTALTPEQIDILKRYTANVKLCFDMDEAGQKAVFSSVQTCLEREVDTEVVLLPDGFKDVNDLTIKDPSSWKKAVEASSPVMEYFFSAITNRHDRNNPKGKRLIASEFLNIVKHIADPIEQSYWIKKLSDAIQVEEDTLTQVLEKVKVKNVDRREKNDSSQKTASKTKNTVKSRKAGLQERLVGLFSLYKDQLGPDMEEAENLLEESYLEIFKKIQKGELEGIQEKVGECEVQVKYGYDDKTGFMELEVDPEKEWEHIKKELAGEIKRKQLRDIVWDIKRAEEDGDEESLQILMDNFSKLSRELGE
ncbi:MAG: DNA primase [Candidatus Moranbacteria bacterium]|nr:DNA primase [Candidatus Moranbacteria bacterium]